VAGYIDSATSLSPATIRHYKVGEALIPPAFGKRDVSTVRPLHIDSMYQTMRDGGASEHKIKKVHQALSVSFNRAGKYGWCATNPCAAADTPRASASEIVPPTPEQVRVVITTQLDVNADTAVAFRLAAATGMRRGELVALQWRDIDGQSLTVRRSLVEDEAKVIHIRSTKTGTRGHRGIKVGTEMAAALEAMRARQAKQCANAGVPVPPWCFTHDLETPWRPDYLTTSFAQRTRALDAAAVKGREASGQEIGADALYAFTLHDLRHFHATQLLAAGVPVAQVSHRLGHSSPAVTLNTYSHWIPANDQESADIIERLL
jgi:integrase